MPKPSPDFDLITLKWAGTYLDGAPAQGSLQLTYGGGVMLDDDLATPINIFPKQIVAPITTLSVLIGGEMKEVGYAEFKVPATNDPDIDGGGGTYSMTESLLDVSTGRTVTFPVDVNAPDGIIWLNKIIPTTPAAGAPISVVYWDDFQSLEARVANIEAGGGGGEGGPVSWGSILDKPATFAPTTGTTAGTAAAGNDTRLSDARTPLAHGHPIIEVTGLQTELDNKQATGDYATSADVTTALGGKADTAHGHEIGDVAGLQGALDAASGGGGAPTVADMPSGIVLSCIHNGTAWPARPTERTDITVHWIGGNELDPPLDAVDGMDIWDRPAT